MRSRSMLIAAVAFALLVAACGGSSKSNNSSGSGTPGTAAPGTTDHVAQVASDRPSESAAMICADEAKKDIAESAIGLDTAQPLKPSWDKDTHVFSCDYLYKDGAKMVLAVKEMSSADETTAYFDSLAKQYGKKAPLNGLGQGAFTTPSGNVVVRKDYKVLLVDVSGLPQQFGIPSNTPRGDDAINVAATIMSCWTGE
jgi:hypothetical protein